MLVLADTLAQRGEGGELVYVIAVLILAAGSAIFEKVRQKMSESESRKPPGAGQAPPGRARPPVEGHEPPVRTAPRPQQPRPRQHQPAPPPARPAPPRPRPAAPPARVPEARRPQVPPARRAKPVPAQRPAPPAAPAPPLAPARSADRIAAPAADAAAARQDVASLITRTVMAPVASVALRSLTPAELRHAIILSEVLGRPLALREEGEGPTDSRAS